MSEAWDRQFDIIVMGSGSAGLSAALTAAVRGAKVLVLEKGPVLGGTSAMSGSGTWIPVNHHMLEAGYTDSREEALAYIRAASPPGWQETEDERWQAFVDTAPKTLQFIEANSPLRFALIHHPDIYMELPGGKDMGRMMEPLPLRLALAGPWKRRIRRSTKPQIFRYEEIMVGDALVHPLKTLFRLWPRLLWRYVTGRRGMGNALVIGLVRGCLDHGVTLEASSRVTGLIRDEEGTGRVLGVRVETPSGTSTIGARRGVVIASGGFEWDDDMISEHLVPAEFVLRGSPSTNTGDGQKLAADAGAQLERMDQANINTIVPVTYERQRHGMPFAHVDYPPHCILVNRHGKRFMNEGERNIGLFLAERDPDTGETLHLPAWRIFDRTYVREQPFFLHLFRRPPPDQIRRASTIEGLARKINVDPQALKATIERFNGFARAGRDEDFHRGETGFERFYAENEVVTTGALGPIETAPFFAVPCQVGVLGTKGGPRTDEHGRVLRPDGSVIAGLTAAGVAMANPFGTRNIGAGTTIGPNMTWGHIGANALMDANESS